jgi:hypothetical protein
MKTAVEWLADRYTYINWLVNRDEISEETANQWREDFLKKAKEMERVQLSDAFYAPTNIQNPKNFEQYYNKKFQLFKKH